MEPVAQLMHETRSSIELKRNAKGEYAYDVKLYFDESTPAGEGNAILRLHEIDGKLRALFVPGEGPLTDEERAQVPF